MDNRLYIFDFDGVIADTLSLAMDEYRRVIEDGFEGVPVPTNKEHMALLFPGPLKTSLRRFGVEDSESAVFFDRHSQAMSARSDEVEVFPEVATILADCDRDSVAIVTSAYSDAVRSVLARSGYSTLAEHVEVLGREMRLPKSEKIRRVADRRGVPLPNVVKIGDMVSDILYAREAGVEIWAVTWGYHPGAYLAAFAPDRIIQSPSELRAIIRSNEL